MEHWHNATVVSLFFFNGEQFQGGRLLIASFLFINVFAFILHHLIQWRVDKLRDLVRIKKYISEKLSLEG
jgi:hypothetical protein